MTLTGFFTFVATWPLLRQNQTEDSHAGRTLSQEGGVDSDLLGLSPAISAATSRSAV